MSSITAAATGSYTARVVLTVDTAIVGPITVWRDSLEGERIPVRGAINVDAVSSVWDDTEAPLNRPVWYVVVDGNGADALMTAEPVTIASQLPILSDPVWSLWVHVTISTDTVRRYPQRSVVLDVEGRRSRVRIFDVEGSPDIPDLKLRTEDAQQLQIARRLFESGRVLLLRGSCVGIEDAWLGLVGQREEQRITTRAADWRRHHVLQALAEDQPTPETRATGDTLDDLHAAVPGTLQDIANRWPTLLDIAADDLGAT